MPSAARISSASRNPSKPPCSGGEAVCPVRNVCSASGLMVRDRPRPLAPGSALAWSNVTGTSPMDASRQVISHQLKVTAGSVDAWRVFPPRSSHHRPGHRQVEQALQACRLRKEAQAGLSPARPPAIQSVAGRYRRFVVHIGGSCRLYRLQGRDPENRQRSPLRSAPADTATPLVQSSARWCRSPPRLLIGHRCRSRHICLVQICRLSARAQ